MPKRFTGYHMTAILVAFFGTVMAVNFTMASFAIGSFGGIQVQNSYVASQNFNDWLDEAEAQEALGYDVVSVRRLDGRIAVTARGPGAEASLGGWARHPLGQENDLQLGFERLEDGSFLSREALPSGRWILRLTLTDGAAVWKREDQL